MSHLTPVERCRGASPSARAARTAAVTLLALGLAGCSLKDPPSTDQLRADNAVPVDTTSAWLRTADTGEVQDDWLATFGDPELDALVREAVRNNADLRVGEARVERAAAYVERAGAQLQPTVDALGRYNTRFGGELGSGLSGGLVVAGWELDVWGRVRYGRRAAVEAYESVVADQEFARQSVAAMTARAWFTLSEALVLADLSRAQVEAAERAVAVAETRVEVGIADERELNLARANLSGFLDTVTQLELARDEASRALEILLGRYPAGAIAGRGDIPELPGSVPAGMPLSMLERRPDLIAAERRVASAFSLAGQARAARLPALSLTASFGALSSELLEVREDFSNPVGGVGASLFAPLFRGGQLRAEVDIADAEQRAAAAEYAALALQAVNEVESALAAGSNLASRRTVLEAAVEQNEETLRLEGIAFRVGTNDLRTVIEQQTLLFISRVQLTNVRFLELIRRVDLHLALGGSFEQAR